MKALVKIVVVAAVVLSAQAKAEEGIMAKADMRDGQLICKEVELKAEPSARDRLPAQAERANDAR